MSSIQKAEVNSIPVIRLSCGSYEADICPVMGANCIRLAKNGSNVMRMPNTMDQFKGNPNVYGTPLLFPPNRIANAAYTFQNRTYHLPVNEPERGHYIHGSLSRTTFKIVSSLVHADEVSAVFSADFHEEQAYPFFPYDFSVTIEYQLREDELIQTLSLCNQSAMDMPLGIGFHTAFALPFLPDTSADEYLLRATVGNELCLDRDTILPTSVTLQDSPIGAALRSGSLRPAQNALSHHFQGLHGEIVLLHEPTGSALHYLPDAQFSFMVLWNGGGHDSGFVCPEPQSWQIDAPNSSLPTETTGFSALTPNHTACFTNRFSIEIP